MAATNNETSRRIDVYLGPSVPFQLVAIKVIDLTLNQGI